MVCSNPKFRAGHNFLFSGKDHVWATIIPHTPPPPYSVLELDQGLRERSERFDREKQMLLDQNKQLKVELDKVMEALISKLKYAFSSSFDSATIWCA